VALTPAGNTVSVAAGLVTKPNVLLTVTVYLPASAGCALASVNVAAVAPPSAAPSLLH